MKIISFVIGIVLIIAVFGALASHYATITELNEYTDTAAAAAIPYNITLSNLPVSFLNVSNGSVEIPSANYTLYEEDLKLEINQTVTGTVSAWYTSEPDGYISGRNKTFLGIVLLITTLGLLVYALSPGTKATR